ncbi:MAG: hypothetical protein Q9176_000349 [Flavoplaca citrina]
MRVTKATSPPGVTISMGEPVQVECGGRDLAAAEERRSAAQLIERDEWIIGVSEERADTSLKTIGENVLASKGEVLLVDVCALCRYVVYENPAGGFED